MLWAEGLQKRVFEAGIWVCWLKFRDASSLGFSNSIVPIVMGPFLFSQN